MFHENRFLLVARSEGLDAHGRLTSVLAHFPSPAQEQRICNPGQEGELWVPSRVCDPSGRVGHWHTLTVDKIINDIEDSTGGSSGGCAAGGFQVRLPGARPPPHPPPPRRANGEVAVRLQVAVAVVTAAEDKSRAVSSGEDAVDLARGLLDQWGVGSSLPCLPQPPDAATVGAATLRRSNPRAQHH